MNLGRPGFPVCRGPNNRVSTPARVSTSRTQAAWVTGSARFEGVRAGATLSRFGATSTGALGEARLFR